jgi:hypothetical protein
MTQATTPRQQFEAQVATLIAKFNQHRTHYLSTAYNETDVRAEFIDPLFEALGWDVSNRAGHGPHDKEVIRERSEVSGRSDYQFQLNGRVMFIVEAKAPHVPLDRTDVIMQAKKYAWNSKETSIAAITDFEEFRLYDATVKPDAKHPEVGLIFAAKYTEYLKPKTANDLWLLSKEAVAAGSIEQLLKMSSVKQRERLPVDVAFLDDLTAWREKLAKAVFKIEPEIDPADLNSVVQVFLDRLIFIRFAEDHGILAKRGLEDVARLWERSGKQRSIVNDLNALFHEVNDLLNGEIFKPHQCEKIDWDAEAALVAKIIQALYDGPYRFDVIGVELLGSIYERYLGKTIRVTATRAMVEDKPEVRKAGGVYYTPKYIVEYIVAQTVGKLIEGKSPAQIAKLKILDPACGSGSFLLGAYQTLIEYHERWYAGKRPPSNSPRSQKTRTGGEQTAPSPVDAVPTGEGWGGGSQLRLLDAGEGGEYRLPLTEKAAILKNNLFGVDIDPQAVEITMMSLYIKLLEGERGAIMDRHVLPPLRDNIKCGNSLIGYDIRDVGAKQASPITDEDLDRIRPFDWHSQSEGFGDIMQAGGFDAVIGNPPYVRPHNISPIEKEYFWKHYDTFVKKSDLYCCFFEQGMHLLKSGARFGIIVSNGWLRLDSFQNLRQKLLSETRLQTIIEFSDDVFEQASVKTTIVVFDKDKVSRNLIQVATIDAASHLQGLQFKTIGQLTFQNTYKQIFDLSIDEKAESIKSKMVRKSSPLGQEYQLAFGLKTGDDSVFLTNRKKDKDHKPLLRGADIHRYSCEFKGEYVWYVPEKMTTHRRTARPGTAERFEQPKMLIRDTGGALEGTYDDAAFYVKDVLVVSQESSDADRLKFLCGILNSQLMKFYYESSFPTLHVQRDELASLPIRAIDLDDPADKAKHDRMVNLVQRMLDLHKQQQAASSDATRDRLQREINVTDEQIDALVYELYGLTEEEIRIVEGEAK